MVQRISLNQNTFVPFLSMLSLKKSQSDVVQQSHAIVSRGRMTKILRRFQWILPTLSAIEFTMYSVVLTVQFTLRLMILWLVAIKRLGLCQKVCTGE